LFSPGCSHDGKFYAHEERWEEDCATYCCQIKNTNNGLMRTKALLKGRKFNIEIPNCFE